MISSPSDSWIRPREDARQPPLHIRERRTCGRNVATDRSETSRLSEAKRSAEVSHDHPEGIKGAQAVVACFLLARQGKSHEEIRTFVETEFDYDLSRTLDEIRPSYHFDETCQGSVPEAIIAFLESTSYEDAVRKAVSLGGDADTLACITGGIAEAYYKVIPDKIIAEARKRLAGDFIAVVDEFAARFTGPG